MQTPHELLGLPENASQETIKQAYRTLALQYHPDKNPKGEEEFKAIQHAYEVLCPQSKKKIDLLLDEQGMSLLTMDWSKQTVNRRFSSMPLPFNILRQPVPRDALIRETPLLKYENLRPLPEIDYKNPNTALLKKIEEAVINDEFDKQIALFMSLGDAFFKDTIFEKFVDWEPLIYASALYNYALALAFEYQELALVPRLQSQVYTIKQAFLSHLGVACPTTQASDLLGIQQRQLQLKRLRQQLKEEYQEQGLDVTALFQKMGTATKDFFVEIFENAMNSIDPTCNKESFSIVTMCSGATNRMHYHSDLDFMILCAAPANRAFLTHFTILAYLLVLELQETPPRSISIPGLEYLQMYYRYPKTNNGLKYDARHGGAFPLVSKTICPKGAFQLLGTPEELITLFKNHMDCELQKKHTLTVKCINTQLLYGNMGLHQHFKALLENLFAEISPGQGYSFAQITGSRMYANDIKNAIFPLRDVYLFKHHLKSFEYVISSLGMMHHLLNTDQEGIVHWLMDKQKIREEDGHLLLKSFEWLKKIRLEMNIGNESGNMNLPILWNYKVFNQYRLKTPALNYFLRDLLGLTTFYCLVHNMAQLKPKSVLIRGNTEPLPLDLGLPTPVYDVLQFISSRLNRNNMDYREFEVLEAYNAFPVHYLYPQSILDHFKRKPTLERLCFLEKALHVGICIASHYFAIGNNKESQCLLSTLLGLFNQFLSDDETRQLAFLNTSGSYRLNEYSRFIERLVQLNANLPTLVANLYYMLGRCYFYDQEHYPQDLARHQLQVAKILRQLIDVRLISAMFINDQYNEKNLDSLLVERSGTLRLALITCDKTNLAELKKIQGRYLEIMQKYEDPIHEIECHCMMLRIDAYLLAASDPRSQGAIIRTAEKRCHTLSNFLEKNTNYTFQQKILNVLAVWEIAQKSSHKAQFLLNKDCTFFYRVKNTQHLREQNLLKAECTLL